MRPFAALCGIALLSVSPALFAQQQEAPALPAARWTAYATASMGVTGDIRTAPGKLILRGHPYAIKLQQVYTGTDLANAAKMFSTDVKPDSRAALYRIDVPGGVKLANGNTFCGGTATTYVIIMMTGKDLEIANFSGDATPNLDPTVLGNSTALCGTLGYTRQ